MNYRAFKAYYDFRIYMVHGLWLRATVARARCLFWTIFGRRRMA